MRLVAVGFCFVHSIASLLKELTALFKFRWAATWDQDSFAYPDAWLNAANEVHIQETFQVVDYPTVFAFGDCSSLAETKQAINLIEKLPILTKNILAIASALSQGKDLEKASLKSYRLREKGKMFLPLGPTLGVSHIGSWTYGNTSTSKMKGRDLFSDMFWQVLTASNAPPIVHQ